MTFTEAIEMAQAPQSRYFFGSPCRFIAHCDYYCHLLFPAVLQSGDLSQLSTWDQGRLWISERLRGTSPRWQHLVRRER